MAEFWTGTIRIRVEAEYIFNVDEGWEDESMEQAVNAARESVYRYLTAGPAPEIWDAIFPEVMTEEGYMDWLDIPAG